MKTIGKNDFFEVFPLIYNHMGVSLRWFFGPNAAAAVLVVTL